MELSNLHSHGVGRPFLSFLLQLFQFLNPIPTSKHTLRPFAIVIAPSQSQHSVPAKGTIASSTYTSFFPLASGDGEWKHIGSKVEMPDAFEIVSNEVTVGRLPDKADIVIPVATVSGQHARIKNQEDKLLVIDLDSTNGTFIDDKRLNPGVVAAVSSGNCITFGDIHLAMFQVSKLKTVEAASKIQEETEEPISDSETS
ncbi:uncharacterized protein E5676_scaffold859G00940 [Cucumis melo var. makuwa]|uniref:FHA domain-containing protein n=1 Tax=Cucumis melo var. makuwa TaxID=1194695 RepID=A0A5D3DDS3_CUCMM|nr:uncharacterized protein E5676_scaffold859G00940 [Cucumis melo var. makuwa]